MFNILIGFALGWTAARVISGQPIIPAGLGQRVEQTVNQFPGLMDQPPYQ